MIALTQNQRDKLIYKLMGLIESYKETASGTDEQIIYEIALASLTAEAVSFYANGAYYNTAKAAMKDGAEDITPLYAAPPVPEIKLPPEFNESHDSFNEFRRGWNGAISEVKRINGLGE